MTLTSRITTVAIWTAILAGFGIKPNLLLTALLMVLAANCWAVQYILRQQRIRKALLTMPEPIEHHREPPRPCPVPNHCNLHVWLGQTPYCLICKKIIIPQPPRLKL